MRNVSIIIDYDEDLHTFFGGIIIFTAIVGMIPNIIFIRMVLRDKKYFILTSFRIMTMLSTINIIALTSIAISGFFTLFESTINYTFNKIVSCFGLPCYPAYCVTSALLSLHCLLQLSRPHLNSKLFSSNNKWWLYLILFVYSFFAVGFAINEVVFNLEQWFWAYYVDIRFTLVIMIVQESTEDTALVISGIIYVLFITYLIKMRKKANTQSQNYVRELRVFVQTLTITFYSLIFNLTWYNSVYFLPQIPPVFATINFLWLINHTLDPIIYLIVNKAIKGKSKTNKKIFVLKTKQALVVNPLVISTLQKRSTLSKLTIPKLKRTNK